MYRYAIGSGEWTCLSCAVPGGRAANAIGGGGSNQPSAARFVAVAQDGSRLYFASRSHLLAGAPEAGTPAIYRVDAAAGSLAYVGPLERGEGAGEDPGHGSEVSADGRFLAFRSGAAALDQLSGSDNGGTAQYYLYDDQERSLLCVSCPPDGSPPRAAAAEGSREPGPAPGMAPLSPAGGLAFATPTALVGADQNTAAAGQDPGAGADVYEWRDGRALLVTDGLTSWPGEGPEVNAISPSGRDLFFTAAARLTPDAIDGYRRLYDARLGGGISFPPEQGPCPLEACQGAPQGAPPALAPGSAGFAGPGNPKRGRSCGALGRKARKLSRRAKRLHRHARRARHAKPRKRMRRKSTRLAKRARGLSKRAKRCRQAKRRNR